MEVPPSSALCGSGTRSAAAAGVAAVGCGEGGVCLVRVLVVGGELFAAGNFFAVVEAPDPMEL